MNNNFFNLFKKPIINSQPKLEESKLEEEKIDDAYLSCQISETVVSIKIKQLNVYMESGVNLNLERFKLIVEQSFDDAVKLLPPEEFISSGTICLHNDQARYDDICETPEGCFFSNGIIHLSPEIIKEDGDFEEIAVIHEIAHFVIREALSSYYKTEEAFPLWFDEGFVKIVDSPDINQEDISFFKEEISQKYLSWDDISKSDEEIRRNQLINEDFTYFRVLTQSFLMIKFLQEKHNQDIIKDIVDKVSKDRVPINKALENITGKSLNQLKREWLLWLSI